jgi:hypothetical protein
VTRGHTGGVDRGDGKCYEEVGMQLWGIGMRALGREGYREVERGTRQWECGYGASEGYRGT